jgi:amino acid adenylation domain-containing protein
LPERGEDFEMDRLLHQGFEAQADRTPFATAVTAGGTDLTYAELEARANRLARHLRALGVGPEVRVGLCLERSEQLLVGILGVLKAGGAYVPLDPAYPAERLAFLLEDSRAPVLITQTSLLPVLPEHEARLVLLDADAGEIAARSPARPEPAALPQTLAYFIYTSGSTGRAKGVAIAHRSASVLVRWALGVFSPEDLACVLFSTSVCFDLSIFEMFVPLAVGGTVAVAGNALELPNLPAAGSVTLINTVPSAMTELVRQGAVPQSVRVVNLAGEALPGALVEAIHGTTPVRRVYNLYGPSEDTTYSTWALIAEDSRIEPPIGRPVDGTRAWLLDEQGSPVAAGETGEIFLGGEGLARGYFDRPDLTADRFVPDPFSVEPGARLYRTGDLARGLPGGDLHYLGRVDHQVKIRGFRIELGEVEAALLRHPAVREAVVVARGAVADRHLVAYFAAGSPEPSARELREHLRKTLPEHMVPAVVVRLEALPRTPNGKVDRKALPEPAPGTMGDSPEPFVAPRTPVEERLAALWAEVLGCGRIGIHDHFFALGGHSLLATRVLARVRDLFGAELPLRALFAAPTVALFAEVVETAGAAPLVPLAATRRDGLLPLSPLQQGLWFLDRLEPGRPAYNIASAVALRGPLDRAALAAALSGVVRRHEALRTRFAEVDGEPRQEVLPPAPVALPFFDISEAELEELGRQQARQRFDLDRGPLLTAALARLGEEEHVLFVTVHHLVFDGWSEGVFWRELSALYTGAELPEPGLQYADYAVWQRRRLDGPRLAEQLDGWRERLDGLPPLELPTDRPRPPRQRFRGGLRGWTLPAPLAGAARDLARREGATPFMALLAGFGATLGVYSGQDDFAVGSPLAGRNASGLEGLVGYFVNMMTLRLDLSGRTGLRGLLARVREESLAAFSQPDVPFDLLVQELNPERDLSRNPLFQVAFQLIDEARPLPALPGIAASSPDLHTGTSKFDLDVELEDRGGAIAGRCEFDLDLFDPATVDRLLGHFNALLAAALAEPDRPLSELSFLSEAETRQLLEWSGADRISAPAATVHRLFEEQARRQPEAPAVDGLTYAGLERRAIRLALRLRELGVGPEMRVGVCLERSQELVVAVLAVLKAGGAYVALDPSHPMERLAFQIEDSGAPVVITHLDVENVFRVSPDEEPRSNTSLDGPEPLPGNLAYVIYTSGSTGRPKGVELTHGSLLNLVEWHVRAFGLTAADRSALVAGVGFDASVWEVWPALSVGASLRVVPEAVRTSPEAVRDWLVEEGITATFLPTPLAEAVLPLDFSGSAMRVLLTGGDRLHRAPSASIPLALVNNYGPTEGTVVATSGTVMPDDDRVPSIGRPIDGARAFVVDRGLRPVPPGVPGELLVGGSGLARGYAGRPDLTAERFVPDPAGDGGRLYRTGDLVRFLPGGELEFLGRIDHQVKIRGYRIEIGEIEAALARHPEVREAAVLVRDSSLVAYVSSEADGLEEFLRLSLPDYMVPAAFVRLPSLPLNTSGKVDRQALARIAPPAPSDAASFADPVEELVAGLWAEVLGRDVRPGDNFFHLGGHSLLATRVLSRLREALGVELPLQTLFETPVLSALARVIAQARRGAAPLVPPLLSNPRGGLLPLSFPQLRLWFMDRLSPDSHTYNIPAAFALRGPLDVAALAGAVAGVADRHEVLRTRFVEVDGQPWQEILPAGSVALPFVDLSGLPPETRQRELARLGREAAERPFDLSRGPLLRAGLVRMAVDEHALLLTLHHIASDGWSEAVFDRELSALYDGSPLPELPVQYADFAVWQRSWPEEVLAGQVDWWRRRLTGLANLEVPTDRARPPVQTFRGETVEVAVPPALAAALRDLSRARRSTLFITLLAAWQALFHRITGQMDVAVGSPVANRSRPEIEGLIGFFVNMLALRSDCGGDPSFGELLGRVRATALEAYDHADVPFERLIDELGLDRDLSRQALVQVMFSLHTPPPVPALRGLETEPLHLSGAVAKFDLTLGLFDRGLSGDDGIDGWIEYSTDLFDHSTVTRLAGWFLNLLATAAEPERRLSELELLSTAERHQLLGEWNDTAAPFPAETLMHQFFETAADRDPAALAAVWNGRELTYAGLEERANRIANLLRSRGVVRGTPVGVWMERSLDMVAGVLAVLKTGGYYVPLDAAWPADRVEAILRTTEAPAVLTRSAHLGRVLEMQWRLPALAALVCLDVETPEPAPEPVDTESVREVFDLVAERSVDRVTAGGFVSSTGLPFSEAEVDEYRDRVLALAAPWIGPEKRVLEIGSGSGLLMWEIAPRVARYVGLDPSPLTQERNRALAIQAELPVGFAHEIEGWAAGSFDLVLIASTAQFFPGPLYLERVIKSAERLLAPGGAVVIADVPDARYPHKVLSVDENFFLDLGATIHHRTTGFDNELRYRYDVVLQRSKERSKALLTSWHVDRSSADRLAPVAAPEDLAYVIHTSGSTGQPKGIVVQHRPVANLIHWIDLRSSDRVLFMTSLCFDLSVWDIFGVLAAGACVHVASEEDLQDAERLMRILLEEPITIWDSAPAALVRLAPLFPSEPAAHSRLRRVMLSGDWIPVTLPDRVRAAFPHAEVMALGGATEATVWSNSYPVGEVNPDWPSIPYGRPMPNAQYHVLDAGLEPCPVGVPGDLYIGGDCLCVGYAHQPDLTAAAFVPEPFGKPGSRIYRTGDRARYFADGNLEFLGRIDHQVKIRGFRIELGEIEVALARHEGVREAVVLAREDVPGDKRLVAYVVPAGELPDLRDFLRQSLPDYMIPSAFVELAALPVTPNGKLDRRALPAPQWDHGATDESAAPATPTEKALAGLWREILGVEHVGIHDGFFDLGGHSLLATQLVARIREAFRVEMPLRVVFQSPVLGELAAALDTAIGVTTPSLDRPIPPVQRGGLLPLSFQQQRLWLVERLTPGVSAYHIPYASRLSGALDVPALASALGALAERHEVLRTLFVERDGQPWQEIQPPAPFVLAVEDLSEGDLESAAREEAARPFDLAAEPPFRARLVRLSAEDHALFLTLHHIASDGRSEEILLEELSALYSADRLPALPVQYADYAAWQRAWPEDELAGRFAHWTARLAGAAALELPIDRPRPPVETFRGGSVPVEVPAPVAAALRGLARERNVTLFMLLLAAWQTLLQRITGQDDVIVGSPVANRDQPEVRGLVGFFVNLLPLRTDLSGDPSFEELLDRVRRTSLEAYEHADVPFDRLVDELRLERDLSRHPIFQALFGLRNGEAPALRLPGVEAERREAATEVAKLDLSLDLVDAGEGSFTGAIEYNSDLFDRATIERMAGHLGNVLAAVAANPSSRLSEIGLLTAEEHAQLLAWNDTAVLYPERGACLHELIEAQAARTPEAPAVSFEGETITYGELGRRSGILAGRLRALGVGPETLVGVCAERSLELPVALLAILRAGGAYVPLDPDYPADRLAFMLEDAAVPVLLTQARLVDRLPAHGARVVLLDGAAELSPEAEGPAAGLDNAAYAIFTSGSTGRPKGVVNTHRGIVNRILWMQAQYGLAPGDSVLQKTPFSFDVSVWELFWPLVTGARLVMARPGGHQDPAWLAEAIAREGITTLHFVPSMLQVFVEQDGLEKCGSLRRVMASGEALPADLAARFFARLPRGVELHNLYGPTEAAVDVTYHACRAGEERVPIGRPVANTRILLLDRNGRTVPVAVAGELHIGGVQVARGYLRRPDLTAERFVPAADGERLYRTGDLARRLPDGEVEYLGRIDHQVKIRGFRIELGEIEAALARHPEVREAVVLARGQAGDRTLVVYVVASAADAETFAAELRVHLKADLPDYMVPSFFVLLESMPVTPNGKADRKALAAIEPQRGAREVVAPRTPMEEELAALWSGLLGVERVGVHDHFFELGGHSLLASQLVARIRDAFDAQIPLSAVFQAPMLEDLARLVEEAAASSPGSISSGGPVLRPVARGRELPLSASQLRQWFLVQLDPESVDYNLPITVRLEGDLDAEALAEALRAVIRRHESLRTTFISVSGRPAAVVAPSIDLTVPVLDLSATPEAQREEAVLSVAMADSDTPFDLTRGPLLRALLIRLQEREHLLVVTVHHIVFDGFSTGVFLRDLSAFYEAEVSGRPADLPALPVQYADYAAWQQEQLQSPAMRERTGRWKERLAGASQVLDLPTDRPRPAVLGPQGELLPAAIPPAGAAEIRKLAAREGVTLFMVLLAGYGSLLSRYTGQEDLNVGTFVANRTHPALESLIGFFVNTLVLRVDLSGNPTFRDLLARVRDMSLDAFENQDVPFESLLDELETERDLSRGPLFQVMFGLQNFAMPTLEAQGLTLRPVNLTEHARTNGDLAFWMWEDGDALSSLLQLSTDLFDGSTVVRMFRHMERLLAAGAADPGLRLSDLPLLTAGETGQILIDWNRPGERELTPDALVHERFERWAELRPDAVALETADRREMLTYAELNRRGNRVAHRLRRLGVGTDSIVGIWAERSVEFVAGVLGVLKAGGAYMPLDPGLPADRVSAILRGSGISVLLARDGRPATLPPFDGEVVALRDLSGPPEDARNPEPWATPESLVYVLFTSGSTGTPKGVLIPHQALANFAETTRRLYGIGPDDRVLQFSSLVFDISVEEIFTAWTAGAALVLRDDEMVSSPASFLRACGELDVQMVDLPTAYWHELGVELAKGEVPLPDCVRSVIFAGERALQERMAGWQDVLRRGGVRLFNSYGPTEATPANSVFDPAETAEGMMTNGLSIGRPMRGARLYVVDPDLRPVPVGVPGELLIAGAGLGRGYAGRPDLTAEKFVPDPFAAFSKKLPGERVYRTGDRVRWLRDGNLEFLGRVDDQVKIRGFRIEPGEIAAVICRHPGVREAVVVPKDGGAAGLRLVAYAAADPGVTGAELRDLLKSALPAYMVPADFVLLESLPLTATGKLDRRALPEPTATQDESYAPPETVTEEMLAEIWADLLGRERVGVLDNFFDLGGHSLLAPQVFSRIEEAFQVELPLRALFEAPTVAELATLVEKDLLAQIEEMSDEEAESLVL